MSIRFDMNNAAIKLCVSGMMLEDRGDLDGAIATFHKAWDKATTTMIGLLQLIIWLVNK